MARLRPWRCRVRRPRKCLAQRGVLDVNGRYGAFNFVPLVLRVVTIVIGRGLVVNFADGFGWEGYLLDPLGLGGKAGTWSGANLGVAFAFVVSFVGCYLLCAARVRRQEQPTA